MKKIPTGIVVRLLMLLCCVALVLVVGLTWSIITSDAISLYLTLVLTVLGTLKIIGVYRDAKEQRYKVLEGMLTSKRMIPGRKVQELQFTCEETVETLLLAGRHGFKVGQSYRLYYQDKEMPEWELPPMFKPANILLGTEVMERSACE